MDCVSASGGPLCHKERVALPAPSPPPASPPAPYSPWSPPLLLEGVIGVCPGCRGWGWDGWQGKIGAWLLLLHQQFLQPECGF